MSQRFDDGATADDLATLSAVADFVINLSISERNHLIYGSQHPMARKTRERLVATLRSALELASPVSLHVTRDAIFCGRNCLERGHPIFRRLAQKLWRFGISSVAFDDGVAEEDLVVFLEVLNEADKRKESREEIEERIRSAPLDRIRIELLRELLTYRERDEVEAQSLEEQQRSWEDLMRRLAAVRAMGGATATPDSASAVRWHEFVEVEEELVDDYATAVVDYLKQLERNRQHDLILQSTDLGKRLQELIESMNPMLRHQIMSTTFTASDVSGELLENVLQLVDLEDVVASLSLLNQRGDVMPATVFQTLSLFSALDSGGDGASPVGGGAGGDDARQRVQDILDALFRDDRIESYVSKEYDRVMKRLRAQTLALAKLASERPEDRYVAFDDVEDHFVSVGRELMEIYPDDQEMVESLVREGSTAVVRELEQGRVHQARSAIQLTRRAQEATGRSNGHFAWERAEVLAPLVSRLESADRWEAEDGVEVLTAVGAAAVPHLLAVLRDSQNIAARKRALEVLTEIDESPAAELAGLLRPDQPWYLQRNALVVFRQRKDPAGVPAAKACWVESEARVRSEILRYLLEIDDGESSAYLEAAMKSPNPDDVLAAARVAGEAGTTEAVELVAERERALARRDHGSELHLGLLKILASKGGPAGVDFVREARRRRSPRTPWAARKFRNAVDEILGGGAG